MTNLGETGGYDGGHRWLSWLRRVANKKGHVEGHRWLSWLRRVTMLMDIGGLAG